MREWFDTVEIQVCSLNCLSYDCHSYGTVLMPILSQDLNLKISRKSGKNVRDIKLSIDAFRLETEVLGKVILVGDSNFYSRASFWDDALFVLKEASEVKERKCEACTRVL